MPKLAWKPLFIVLTVLAGVTSSTEAADTQARGRRALARLKADSDAGVQVVMNPATTTARLLLLPVSRPPLEGESLKARSIDFFHRYGQVFGIEDAVRELEKIDSYEDGLGRSHVSFRQVYQGVPVFAGVLRTHFNPDGELVTINGSFVPDLSLDPAPVIGTAEAAATARALAAKEHGLPETGFETSTPRLVVYRTGLARGVPGSNHLAWEMEVTHRGAVRDILFIDAHRGTLVDRIDGIRELNRIAHHHEFRNEIWREGDALPFTGIGPSEDLDVNNLIESAAETYSLFANLSGGAYLSYNGGDIPMQSIYDADGLQCPNARWDGRTTEFCPGMAVDDVIAHEWTHAYTDFNHDLIYQWQPGALNESYSDIFGELVDLANGRGLDTPSTVRRPGECSVFGGRSISLTVHSPEAVARAYMVGDGVFNPLPPWSVTGRVEVVNDGVAEGDNTLSDACDPPLVGFTAGRIALIDRGGCFFRDKVIAAEDAGAIGVIIANNAGDDLLTMGPLDPGHLEIPALFIGQSDGEAIKAALADGVEATMAREAASDNSVRWLVAEDSTFGASRDMWNPVCFSDPGRVSDPYYFCGEDDNGGVHVNSGIPNHAFALLVDGGDYNGHGFAGIGSVKAAHIYWTAMSVYQVPTTDFADHADLLELSCSDLVGEPLTDHRTGEISSKVIDLADCAQVAEVTLAVEMRSSPLLCIFQPLLASDPPKPRASRVVWSETFDGGHDPSWQVSNQGVYTEYVPRNWEWTDEVPEGGDGGAFFAIDSPIIGDCNPGSNDQSGVMLLESPAINLPDDLARPILLFDHYVATEPSWDGGNLKVSVNGGPYVLVPTEAFFFNPYNDRIIGFSGENENANPLAGEPAFTGMDEGRLVGSWGQSQVHLGALSPAARPGDTIRIRFDFGVDGCNGNDGWYVDNIQIVAVGATTSRASRRLSP